MSAGWKWPLAAEGGVAVPDPSALADNKWLKTTGGVWVSTDAPSGGGDLGLLAAVAPPSSPDAEDEEFASTDGLTWVNQGTSTVTYAESCMVLSIGSAGGGTGRFKSLSGSDWTYRAHLWQLAPNLDITRFMNLALRESATGKLTTIGLARRGGPLTSVSVAHWTDITTFSSYAANIDLVETYAHNRPIFVEVRKSGSTLSFHYRWGWGGPFVQVASHALTTHFTTAPDQIGFSMFQVTVAAVGVADFLRKIA
jgi:hypothetical protein